MVLCHDLESTCQAKYLVSFIKCAIVNFPKLRRWNTLLTAMEVQILHIQIFRENQHKPFLFSYSVHVTLHNIHTVSQ
jgi:hypothetical protein